MATQTLATADAILKDLYRGPIIEQVNYKTYLLDKIDRDSEHVDASGKRAIVPLESAANPSRGSIPDGGTLPTPGKESYADAIIPIRYHAGGFEITDQLVKQSKKSEGAFASALERGTKNIAKTIKKNANRQLFSDGSGLLATVILATGPATTVSVDATQYLKVNDPVDVLTRSNGAVVSAGRTITAINRTTKVITLDAAVTVTLNEGIYLAGSYGLEMEGLIKATATGRSMHGIDSSVAGNEYWNGVEKAAAAPGSTATIGESLFEQLDDDVGAGGNGEVGLFLTTRGIRRRLADTYVSNKRFNDANAVNVHGGYSAILVNEKPVIADDDAPKGYAFALPGPDELSDSVMWYEVEPPDWLTSEDGTVWHLASGSVAGTKRTAWQAWFVWYASIGWLAPNRMGRIVRGADDYV